MTVAVRQLTLVTGSDCHLCDRARRLLGELGVATAEVDVTGDAAQALTARGIPLSFLPVLTDGRNVIAYGRFSEKRLRKDLGL